MILRSSLSWFLIWLQLGNGVRCPTECTCHRNEKRVVCNGGGMRDPIPVADMPPEMEYLEISAPAGHPNSFTLGPIFHEFKQLRELHVRRSGLAHIGTHPFWGVPSLRVLNLSANSIGTVVEHNFRGLVNLIELDLERNRLERIPGGVFRHLSELKVLNLESNALAQLTERAFAKLSKLEVLRLNWNPLLELDPEVFKDVPELRILQCRGCGLRRINTQIYHLLPYMTHLDLGDNALQFIDADEFVDLQRLRVLHLDGNQLPVILEKTFARNYRLRFLDVSRNRIAKLTDDAFFNLTNLLELDIGYNKLDRLEAKTLSHVGDKLEKLVLSGNQFTSSVIKVALQIAGRVRDLSLSDMGIDYLKDGFLPDQVEKLNLSGNHLKNLTSFVLPKQLNFLDVSRNLINTLNEEVIIYLENIKVNFEGNPFICDLCHASGLLFRLNTSKFISELKCAKPNNLKGRSIASLTYKHLKPCADPKRDSELASFVKNKLGLVIAGVALILFLVICVLFVVVSCVRRHPHRRHKKEKPPPVSQPEEISMDSSYDKTEIKFALDLTLNDRRVSVSTIDEMKKRKLSCEIVPNGT